MNDSYKRLLNLVLDNRTDEETLAQEVRTKDWEAKKRFLAILTGDETEVRPKGRKPNPPRLPGMRGTRSKK